MLLELIQLSGGHILPGLLLLFTTAGSSLFCSFTSLQIGAQPGQGAKGFSELFMKNICEFCIIVMVLNLVLDYADLL
jgi:hypothetical protein